MVIIHLKIKISQNTNEKTQIMLLPKNYTIFTSISKKKITRLKLANKNLVCHPVCKAKSTFVDATSS